MPISLVIQDMRGQQCLSSNSRGGGHEAPDAQPVPLSAGEAQALVEQRVAQQVLARLPHNLGLHELAVHHLAGDPPPLVT